jgi:quercetin dioxygenase-like cupin family protein
MQGRSLIQLGEEHLLTAKASSSGRSAVTIHGGQEHDLRQTLIALVAGSALHEHESPGEATVQVLTGDVRLTAADGDTWEGTAGDHLVIPPQRHSLDALTDAVVLLTVATRA